MSKTHNPSDAKTRNQPQTFRYSADNSSRHQPEKAAQKDKRSKSGSDKARGESTEI